MVAVALHHRALPFKDASLRMHPIFDIMKERLGNEARGYGVIGERDIVTQSYIAIEPAQDVWDGIGRSMHA